MNKEFPKEILPVTKDAFQKHLLHSLFLQVGVVGLIFILLTYLSPLFSQQAHLLYGICFIVHGALLSYFLFLEKKYLGRFKDIYPSSKISRAYYLFALLFPPLFLAITLFLCFKEKSAKSSPSFLFTPRFLTLIFGPIFALQIYSPKVAYISGLPSTYFVVDVAHDAFNMLALRKGLRPGADALKEYAKKHGSKLRSFELILLNAIQVMNTFKSVKKKDRSIKNKFSRAISYLNHVHKTLEMAEKSSLEFTDYSVFQWLYPTGLSEISLLAMFELGLKDTYGQYMKGKSSELLSALEKEIEKLPEVEKKSYLAKLAIHRERWDSNNSFRGIASDNEKIR